MSKWFRIVYLMAGLGAGVSAVAQTAEQPEPGVGIIDSGTNAGGFINLAGGRNIVGDPEDLSDQSDNQHGTASSQIVNAQAPGIPIFVYKVFTSEPATQGATDAGIVSAAAEPDVKVIAVVNGALGASSVIPTAAAQNKLVSVSAGNTAGQQPEQVAIAAAATLGVVIASATDGAGGALPGAAICGITAARCVRARGVTPFADYSGASFSAANIAGIAAQVWRTAPWLTNEELAQVLFATALDFGDPGVDPVYGNGFIADAAQVINSPAGPTSVPTGDGGSGGGGAIAVVALVGAGAAYGLSKLGKKNEDDLKKTLVLDPYGRPFVLDMTKMMYVRDTTRFSISNYLQNLDEMYNTVGVRIGDSHAVNLNYSTFSDDRFDVGRHFAMQGDLAYADKELDWSASFRSTQSHGLNYQMDINTDPALNFGALNAVSQRAQAPVAFLSGQKFSTPFVGFSERADSVSMGFADHSGWDVKFAVVNAEDKVEYGPKSVAELIEGSYNFGDRAKLTAQFGRMEEAGSLLGGSRGGIFGVDDAVTYAVSLSGALHLTNQISLIGNYGVGYTSVTDAKSSLLRNASDMRTNWFGLGLIGFDLFNDRDQWGVAFSQPLRLIEGEVDMRVPYARDVPGNIYYNENRVDLTPTGREYVVETFYRYNLNRRASVGAHFMYQHEPEHDAEAGDELTFLTTLRYGF